MRITFNLPTSQRECESKWMTLYERWTTGTTITSLRYKKNTFQHITAVLIFCSNVIIIAIFLRVDSKQFPFLHCYNNPICSWTNDSKRRCLISSYSPYVDMDNEPKGGKSIMNKCDKLSKRAYKEKNCYLQPRQK